MFTPLILKYLLDDKRNIIVMTDLQLIINMKFLYKGINLHVKSDVIKIIKNVNLCDFQFYPITLEGHRGTT